MTTKPRRERKTVVLDASWDLTNSQYRLLYTAAYAKAMSVPEFILWAATVEATKVLELKGAPKDG